MKSGRLSTLIRALADICRDEILAEKYLIAPRRRVGFQWLDTVTRTGQPVLNVHVKTLRHIALDAAAAEIKRRGLTFLRGVRQEVILNRIFGTLTQEGKGYLSALNASPGLVRALRVTIRDLRLAGLTSKKLQGKAFEVASKGRQIKLLSAEYERTLETEKLADYADVLRIAAKRLGSDRGVLPEGTLVLLPQDMEKDLRGLERIFWSAVPAGNRRILPVDHAGSPAPGENGTAAMFRAVGEVNEVREVLRRCVEKGIPFDDVEILHADRAVYVPLIYEMACRVDPGDTESIPVTFDEGIPARFSRPGRALLAWLSWIREDFPQSTLMRMIQDGLLKIPEAAKKKFSFTRLAAMFRSVSVGAGSGRYLKCLDEEIAGIERQTRQQGTARGRTERIEGLRIVRNLVKQILAGVPSDESGQGKVLQAAADFIEKQVRRAGEVDEYSREILLERVNELIESLAEEGEIEGLDVRQWLTDLPAEARVLGRGPRPGCLYVSSIYAGGHSGRGHTFIIGLDDSRFPGAGLQDPFLLDGERSRISPDLPTASGAMAEGIEDFADLLARLRGNVTLSYCCRSLADDREMFPSPVFLAVFRILSGNYEGDQDDLLRWLPDPVSFAPHEPLHCIDPTEWWLWRVCGSDPVKDPQKLVAQHFPHLGRGMIAGAERQSDSFTVYDGWVKEAGKDLDPTRPDGPILSASRLEVLGRCPMEYFFKYVLQIEPPEEYEIDPAVWLDALQKGTLLHAVFREFMVGIRESDQLPEFPRDEDVLYGILDRHVKQAKAQMPPPNRSVFERDCSELKQTARIFLIEEAEFCSENRPLYLEVALGLAPEGKGTALDQGAPVPVVLPDGREIRARGRIDRVDEISTGKGGRYAVWDYKTGGSYGFDEKYPFRGGRKIQSALYLAMIEARLRESVSPGAVVERFGYFFPNVREHGTRIAWSAGDLADGIDVVTRLCDMMAAGCFPFSDDPDDVKYSDYAAAFGDPVRTAEGMRGKIENAGNKMLGPLRALRGYEKNHEEE